jgi:hypothetical protein
MSPVLICLATSFLGFNLVFSFPSVCMKSFIYVDFKSQSHLILDDTEQFLTFDCCPFLCVEYSQCCGNTDNFNLAFNSKVSILKYSNNCMSLLHHLSFDSHRKLLLLLGWFFMCIGYLAISEEWCISRKTRNRIHRAMHGNGWKFVTLNTHVTQFRTDNQHSNHSTSSN